MEESGAVVRAAVVSVVDFPVVEKEAEVAEVVAERLAAAKVAALGLVPMAVVGMEAVRSHGEVGALAAHRWAQQCFRVTLH